MKIIKAGISLMFALSVITGSAERGTADILILKNGRQIKAENFWEDDGVVKYSSYGATVGYPKEEVDKIIKESTVGVKQRSFNPFYPWSIGQGIEEVISLCERYDIPLHREGLISSNKHFNPKMCRPYLQTHARFTYNGVAFNGPSKYTLSFDPTSKTLKNIEIKVLKATSEKHAVFLAKIEAKLFQVYGRPMFFDGRKIWQRGKNKIELLKVSNAAIIKWSEGPIVYSALESQNTKSIKKAEPSNKAPPVRKQTGLNLGSMLIRMIGPFIAMVCVLAALLYFKMMRSDDILHFLFKGFRAGKRSWRTGPIPSSHKTGESGGASPYEKASGLFTNAEKDFLSVLKMAVGDRYLIQGKVRLADIIVPETKLSKAQSIWAFRRISQKHVDFVICDKNDYTILGVVELDDKSHFRLDRIARDRFVDAALDAAGIPILHYPVKANYSASELKESLHSVLGLDLGEGTKNQGYDEVDEDGGCEDDPFTDNEEDLRWTPPKFKL